MAYKLPDSVIVKLIESEKKYFEEVARGSPNSATAVLALLEKNSVYQQFNKFESALKNLLRISVDSLEAHLAQQVRYELAIAYYTTGNLLACQNLVYQFLTHADKQDSSKIQWLNILSLLDNQHLKNIDTVQKLYQQFVIANTEGILRDSLLSLWSIPKLKNPVRAERLSLIPGLGQIYAGDWKKGITSIFIQSAFIGLGSYWLLNRYYITSALVGYGMFFSFYMGGQRLAFELTERANQKKIQNFNQDIRQVVLFVERYRRKK